MNVFDQRGQIVLGKVTKVEGDYTEINFHSKQELSEMRSLVRIKFHVLLSKPENADRLRLTWTAPSGRKLTLQEWITENQFLLDLELLDLYTTAVIVCNRHR